MDRREAIREPSSPIAVLRPGQPTTDAIEKAIGTVIASNPGKVEELKSKPNLLGWLSAKVIEGDRRERRKKFTKSVTRFEGASRECPQRGDSHICKPLTWRRDYAGQAKRQL